MSDHQIEIEGVEMSGVNEQPEGVPEKLIKEIVKKVNKINYLPTQPVAEPVAEPVVEEPTPFVADNIMAVLLAIGVLFGIGYGIYEMFTILYNENNIMLSDACVETNIWTYTLVSLIVLSVVICISVICTLLALMYKYYQLWYFVNGIFFCIEFGMNIWGGEVLFRGKLDNCGELWSSDLYDMSILIYWSQIVYCVIGVIIALNLHQRVSEKVLFVTRDFILMILHIDLYRLFATFFIKWGDDYVGGHENSNVNLLMIVTFIALPIEIIIMHYGLKYKLYNTTYIFIGTTNMFMFVWNIIEIMNIGGDDLIKWFPLFGMVFDIIYSTICVVCIKEDYEKTTKSEEYRERQRQRRQFQQYCVANGV